MLSTLIEVTATLAAIIFLWTCVIYPLFLSPLVCVPVAHPLAHLSSLWIEWHRLRGTDFQKVSESFKTKGPYVRLGPRELAVNDIEAVHSVWGVGSADFDKPPIYEYWATQGVLNTFTSVHGPEHRRRHRRIRGVHNRAFIASSPHIREIMRSLMIDRLHAFLWKVSSLPEGTADALPIALSLILGCTSAFAFGLPQSLDFLTDIKARQEWFSLFIAGFPVNQSAFWLREHPQLTKFLRRLGIPIVSEKVERARHKFEAWALPKVDIAEKILHERDKGVAVAQGHLPVLYDAIRSDLLTSNIKLNKGTFELTPTLRRELASECLDHIAFTAEAFGTVFTYMIYELSHHQEVQSQLIEELHSFDNPLLHAGQRTIPDSQTLEALPILGAVIKECLRLRNTSPNPDPRVTPRSGSSRVGKLVNVPPNTRVCSYGWCLHRNPQVYASPLDWSPSRWLDSTSNDAITAQKWFFAFGAGSRKCIGQQIAMELFRMSLATVYSIYTTNIVDETKYPGRNVPMSSYLDEELIVKFTRQL